MLNKPMKKIKAFRRFIVNKLGGVMWRDLPLHMQQDLLNSMANKTIDKHYHDSLASSFTGTTEYHNLTRCKQCNQ